MTAMLEIGDLHVSYGQVDAVRGVSLSLEHGQIISVIGPNGAGKTTLLAAAMGLLPSKGLLKFEGEDLHGLDVEARVERGLCLVPEKRELFGELSVLDNLQLGAFSKRLGSAALKRQLQQVYERFPRLAERRAQRADTLSGGERQMLAVGRAMMGRPKLLMLDEPAAGLRRKEKMALGELLRKLRDDGVTILIVEHDMDFVMKLVDRLVVMNFGSKLVEGAPSAVRADERVQAAYLGSVV